MRKWEGDERWNGEAGRKLGLDTDHDGKIVVLMSPFHLGWIRKERRLEVGPLMRKEIHP